MMWVVESIEILRSWAWNGRGKKEEWDEDPEEGQCQGCRKPGLKQGLRRRSWFIVLQAAKA